MDTKAHNQPQGTDIERTAAEWFFRRDGGFSLAEAKAFQLWLAEDDWHVRAFAEIEGTWEKLGSAREKMAEGGQRSDVAQSYHLRTCGGDVRDVVKLDLPARPSVSTRRPGKISWLSVSLAAAAVITIAFVGRQTAAKRSPEGSGSIGSISAFAAQAATEIGGFRKIDLPDGSFVTLNTNTAVDVQFTAVDRRVRLLRGEALFAVAKNPSRPFIVEANAVAVRAVGTAFNVRLQPDVVEVTVIEGRVRVDDAALGRSLLTAPITAPDRPAGDDEPEQLLVSGEKIVISVRADAAPAPAVASAISAHEVEQRLAWQKRRLEYVDVPLSEIVADFNRYNQHHLVISDATLARRRFGGTFPAGDYNSFLEILEKTFGVVIDRRERETVLRLP